MKKSLIYCAILLVLSACKKEDDSSSSPDTNNSSEPIVLNGDFEEINTNNFRPQDWTIFGDTSLFIDSTTKQSGNNSLKVYEYHSTPIGAISFYQTISAKKIIQGETYKLEFWMKNTEMDDSHSGRINILQGINQDQILYQTQDMRGPKMEQDWTKYSYDFIPQNDASTASYKVQFDFQNDGMINEVDDTLCVWIDNISITRK